MAEESERQSLMQKLLDSVKQCQVTFGGKTNLATDKDSSVLCMVNQFEHSLQHGLKKNKILEKITSISEPLRQVTQKILPEMEITFWAAVKENLGPLDVQHYQTLEGVTTDTGRARVWLRTAINENSLERQLNAMLSDSNVLRQFYEPWALLLDEERSSTLPIMARGLGSILFAINTKHSELNQPFKQVPPKERNFKTHRRINSSPLPIMAGFETGPSILKKINVKKKKKKKVLTATISDLDELPNDAYSSSYEGTASSFLENFHQNSSSYENNKTIHEFCEDIDNTNVDKDTSLEFHNDLHGTQSAPVSPLFKSQNDTFVDTLTMTGQNNILADVNMTANKTVSSTKDPIEPLTGTVSMSNIGDPMKPITGTISTSNIVERETIPPSNETNLPIIDSVTSTVMKSKHTEKTNSSLHLLSNTDDENIDLNPIKNELNSMKNNSLSGSLNLEYLLHESSGNSSDTSLNIEVTSNSSSSGSVHDVDVLGSENSKYVQLFMSYDQESVQAASDTLALLTASTENEVFDLQQELVTKPKTDISSVNMEKYIPKITSASPVVNDETDLSAIDLKQAILATAKKKDEVEQRNRVLKAAVEEQRELARSIQSDYDVLYKENQETSEANNKKIQDMNREIEVLKNQLKKYVAAVQMLRNDRILTDEAKEAIGNLRVSEDVAIPPVPKERTISENDSIFEEKLAQMAEMHGELMELQEILQRQLVARDNQITRMKQELVSLRGPLPDESPQGANAMRDSSESLYAANRLLINIWIPSVFLKGKGTDAHHLYQIYVRIGDEEWNIYRRYSQFNKLHLQMCKIYPALEKFNFPKKKMFGKKDIKFVEIRRRKLQEYLRTVINTLIASHTELSQNSSKKQLIRVLPFFADQFGNQDDKKKTTNKKDAQFPQYTGL